MQRFILARILSPATAGAVNTATVIMPNDGILRWVSLNLLVLPNTVGGQDWAYAWVSLAPITSTTITTSGQSPQDAIAFLGGYVNFPAGADTSNVGLRGQNIVTYPMMQVTRGMNIFLQTALMQTATNQSEAHAIFAIDL